MLTKSMLGAIIFIACYLPIIGKAATPPLNPAVVTATTPGGIGYVTFSRDGTGINAQLGQWGIPYLGGLNGPRLPGAEPNGSSTFSIDVDVNDGGLATFSYTLKTYDAGIYDWYDISLVTPTGTRSILNRLGKPGSDYGTYYSSPQIVVSVSLNEWKNQHVTFVFSVRQDGWGDETQGEVIGFGLRTCTVPPLTPITDPVSLRFEGGDTVDTADLQADMQTGLGCLRTAVTAAHGTVTVTSAFRPPIYQQHLREVWDKWRLLRDKREVECEDLRATVQAEFVRHSLLLSQRPAADNGPHTTGSAIDMRSSLPESDFLPLAQQCGLIRPLPATDSVHFTHQ